MLKKFLKKVYIIKSADTTKAENNVIYNGSSSNIMIHDVTIAVNL